MAEHGHYGGREGASRQGIYVCSPSGEFLASINTTNADRALAMMKRGLQAWDALPEARRKLADQAEIEPRHRWEESYPDGGLVLSMFARDLPEDCDPSQPTEVKWNQDQLWYTRAEARRWLPERIEPGVTHTVPPELIARMARFNLVDTVKGQTTSFSHSEILDSRVDVEIVSLDQDFVSLRFTGATKAESVRTSRRNSAHGVVTRLMGRAVFNLQKESFEEFEMVALGRRWGYTRFNGRRRDGPAGPVGYVFRKTRPDAPRIAPAFLFAYGVEWVIRP